VRRVTKSGSGKFCSVWEEMAASISWEKWGRIWPNAASMFLRKVGIYHAPHGVETQKKTIIQV